MCLHFSLPANGDLCVIRRFFDVGLSGSGLRRTYFAQCPRQCVNHSWNKNWYRTYARWKLPECHIRTRIYACLNTTLVAWTYQKSHKGRDIRALWRRHPKAWPIYETARTEKISWIGMGDTSWRAPTNSISLRRRHQRLSAWNKFLKEINHG